MERVRIEIDVPSVGKQVHEFEHCLIPHTHSVCPIVNIECEFGLSQTTVPGCCPMRFGTMKMLFKAVHAPQENKE